MINDIKDLRALFKLCRAQGITEFKMNGVEIKFGDMPQSYTGSNAEHTEEDTSNPYANFPDRILTPEELTYYAVGGLPKEEDKEAG